MKKFICLVIFAAFAAQSEASLKCFKVNPDIRLYEFNQCYQVLIANNTAEEGRYQAIVDNVEKNKTYLQTQGKRWCDKQYELMPLCIKPKKPSAPSLASITTTTTLAPARRKRQTSWQGCIDTFGPYTAAFLDETTGQFNALLTEVSGSEGTLESLLQAESTIVLTDPMSDIITNTVNAILAANQNIVTEYKGLICTWINTESANAISESGCLWCVDYVIAHPNDLINALTTTAAP